MKIKISKLKPNPFRKIKKYPINRDKVESLKVSMRETTFWDNILARPSRPRKNGFEIAYGHHRLLALQELGIKEVDIPVRNLDDGQMIRIMANENLDEWKTSPAVAFETVLVVKEFLDKELKKYKTWEGLNAADKNISGIVSDKPLPLDRFKQLKSTGVGRDSIRKFLGGNWKAWIIQDALNTIGSVKDKTISKKAISELESTHHSQEFKKEVKKHKIPPAEQTHIAKQIKKQGTGYRGVAKTVKNYAKETGRIKPPLPKVKEKPIIDDFVIEVMKSLVDLDSKLIKLVDNIQYIGANITKKRLSINLTTINETINKILEEIKND